MRAEASPEPGASELRMLAAEYHARAGVAEPDVARILDEIADDLLAEAHKLESLS